MQAKIYAATDLTLLKPTTVESEISALCEAAAAHQFAAVCIPPTYVEMASRLLDKSSVRVATVVDFPYGYSPTTAKVEAIKKAVDRGVDELDIVINIAALKSGHYKEVEADFDSVVSICRLRGKTCKIIVESGIITTDELAIMLQLANRYHPDFVKTSTGINGPGAALSTVGAMRATLQESIKIKASGGIRDAATAAQFLAAGASRLGASGALSWFTDGVTEDTTY